MRYVCLFLGFLLVGLSGSATASVSTPPYSFDVLAKKMGLKKPRLTSKEYEVRLWVKVSLVYGDAHYLHIIEHTKKELFLSNYSVHWDKHTFKQALCLTYRKKVDPAIWQQLLADSLLNQPDPVVLARKLSPPPVENYNRVSVTADSGIVVKAPMTRRRFIVADGTNYQLEIFAKNAQQAYNYHCPALAAQTLPEYIELQRVVSLLKQIFSLFDNPVELCEQNRLKPYPFTVS